MSSIERGIVGIGNEDRLEIDLTVEREEGMEGRILRVTNITIFTRSERRLVGGCHVFCFLSVGMSVTYRYQLTILRTEVTEVEVLVLLLLISPRKTIYLPSLISNV